MYAAQELVPAVVYPVRLSVVISCRRLAMQGAIGLAVRPPATMFVALVYVRASAHQGLRSATTSRRRSAIRKGRGRVGLLVIFCATREHARVCAVQAPRSVTAMWRKLAT